MISLRGKLPHPIGLHLGIDVATLVQLTDTGNNCRVHAMAQGALPVNESAAPEDQDRVVAAALKKLVGDYDFKGREVVTCLASDELFVQNVRLPELPPEEVEKVVRWEAEERLPYSADDAEIRHLLAGRVRQDTHVKQEVILLACRREVVERHVGVIEQAGLVPVGVDAEPCAIVRSFRQGDGAQDAESRTAYFNIGQIATTIIFTEADQILFLKYVATGGRHLDEAVARNLDIPMEQAVRMRSGVMVAETLDAENDVHRTVIESIRPSLEDIASEIELCLRYYKVTFRGKPLERIVLTGPDAAPWLAEYLGDQLQMQCFLGNPLQTVSGIADQRDRPGRWTTALGLSMKSAC